MTLLSQHPDEPANAELVGDRAVVWDSRQGSHLYKLGYYGQPVGIRKPKSPDFDKPLELSLIESAYLVKLGLLRVKNTKTQKYLKERDIVKLATKLADDFKDRFHVYSQLRDLGYVVRSGLKFGTDFVVYERGPGKDHAPFIVHVIPQRKGVVPLDIVRAGRLATSVRKKFIIATVKENGEIA